jgi:hypothetical protein
MPEAFWRIVKLMISSIRGSRLTNIWWRSCVLVLAMLLPFFYNNCGPGNDQTLVPLSVKVKELAVPPPQTVQVNFCTPASSVQNTATKTLIILDHSGSNFQNYKMSADGSGAPDTSTGSVVILPTLATDPNGLLRYGSATASGTLLNYLSTLPPNDPNKPSHYFALIDFNDKAPLNSEGSKSFTSDVQSFYNIVLNDKVSSGSLPTGDAGATSYVNALTAGLTLINQDIAAAEACAKLPTTTAPTSTCLQPGVPVASSYIVVFMSDGSPIIKTGLAIQNGQVISNPLDPTDCPYPNALLSQVICKESTDQILGIVGQMVQLTGNRQFVAGVNLFTLYYYVPGNVDAAGQQLLQQMAAAGNGLAYSALSGSNVTYSQFQPPLQQAQYSLQDVFVTNASGVWWSDGNFYADTDGDGLPDFIEKQWGSDPLNPRTAGNGISDLVRYQLSMNKGSSCSQKGSNGLCQDFATDMFAQGGPCSGLIPPTKDPTNASAVLYHSSDPSGLNDCEKVLLGDSGGIDNPDSNGDSIPDWLEFINKIPFQIGSNPGVNNSESDNYTLYEKVKYSLPTAVSLNNYPQIKPSVYNLKTTNIGSGQPLCYSLEVTNLPSATPTDKIRVDVIFSSNLVNVQPQYNVGIKSYISGQPNLIINDWNDPSEVQNKTWSSWP